MLAKLYCKIFSYLWSSHLPSPPHCVHLPPPHISFPQYRDYIFSDWRIMSFWVFVIYQGKQNKTQNTRKKQKSLSLRSLYSSGRTHDKHDLIESDKCYNEKNTASLQVWEWQRQVVILKGMVRIALTEKSILKQSFKGGEGVNQVTFRGKTVLDRGLVSE